MALTWPEGIRAAGVPSGIKPDGRLDLGLIAVEESCAWAGTFTRNAAAAAPVRWSRALRGRPVRAIVVNSGNANACTGEAGVKAVESTAWRAALELGCPAKEVLVASTGPIGVQLPADKIDAAIPAAAARLCDDPGSFARSILTTDTTTKLSRADVDGFRVVGVAKGAAMLAPNMATMLAFIATDAAVDQAGLQAALSPAVARSFDRISVDACESTNDSVFLLSSAVRPVGDSAAFAAAIQEVCRDLAEQMVRDAEGGSRLVRIQVTGAVDEEAAVAIGRGVAASALWRAALHGADPNWGRVVAAMGVVDRDIELADVELSIGAEVVFAAGEPVGSLEAAAAGMAGAEVAVGCRVGTGDGSGEVLTADLSPEYVTLNASGTS